MSAEHPVFLVVGPSLPLLFFILGSSSCSPSSSHVLIPSQQSGLPGPLLSSSSPCASCLIFTSPMSVITGALD